MAKQEAELDYKVVNEDTVDLAGKAALGSELVEPVYAVGSSGAEYRLAFEPVPGTSLRSSHVVK